jgi:molybdenum cofactor biosynthesis enzyme MoaA
MDGTMKISKNVYGVENLWRVAKDRRNKQLNTLPTIYKFIIPCIYSFVSFNLYFNNTTNGTIITLLDKEITDCIIDGCIISLSVVYNNIFDTITLFNCKLLEIYVDIEKNKYFKLLETPSIINIIKKINKVDIFRSL